MSEVCDDEYDVYVEREVKARKTHLCDACRESIEPGHVYWRVGMVYDGSAQTVKRCLRCQAIHLHLRKLCWSREGCLWPAERLDCGLTYEDEWGPLPDKIAALAFVTGADPQPGESK